MSEEPASYQVPDTMAARCCEHAVAEAKSMGGKDVVVGVLADDGSYYVLWAGRPVAIMGLAEFLEQRTREDFSLLKLAAREQAQKK